MLRLNRGKMTRALRSLSSGLRINDASDDAAGLAISEHMKAQIKGLDQASRNAQDGISLIQTAEGALMEIQSILLRVRTLCVQAANDTYTSEDRICIQNEVNDLTNEVDRITATTQFNGKNLLDGAMSAIGSTDNIGAEFFMRGGIASLDQFRQRISAGGNYRIEVSAVSPGQGQILKSNIITAPLVERRVFVSDPGGGTTPSSRDLADILGAGNISTTVGLNTQFDGSSGTWTSTIYNSSAIGPLAPNNYCSVFMDFSGLGTTFQLSDLINAGFSSTCATCGNYYSIRFVDGGGDKYETGHGTNGNNYLLDVDISGVTTGEQLVDRIINAVAASPGMRNHYTQYAYEDGNKAKLYVYDYRPTINPTSNSSTFDPFARDTSGDKIDTPEEIIWVRPITDSSIFYDQNGKYLIDKPETITVTQGDGKSASFILYEIDTIESIIDKLNEAIGGMQPNGLGQDAYGTGGGPQDISGNYATYVHGNDIQPFMVPDGKLIESVPGTIIIRSAVAGKDGNLVFSGSEAILNALGLTTLVESRETVYSVSVYDAHTNRVVANNVNVSGNLLIGLIDPVIDIKIAANTAVDVIWNDTAKYFEWPPKANGDTFYAHIKNNPLIFHIGANQQQDVIVAIGRYDSKALGIYNLLLTSNALANDALGKVDAAIKKISNVRSYLGAYQNALEHAINNLTASSENLTAAESRIRSADMAKMMMDFVKLSILNDSGMSMLSQANMAPQQVLRLLR